MQQVTLQHSSSDSFNFSPTHFFLHLHVSIHGIVYDSDLSFGSRRHFDEMRVGRVVSCGSVRQEWTEGTVHSGPNEMR